MNDPLAGLRQANPVAEEELPSASLARVRARVQEETHRRSPGWRGWRRLRVAPTGAGLTFVAAALAVVLYGSWTARPAEPPASNGGGMGFCVDPYSREALARRSLAFDGTVTAAVDEAVTFEVHRAFRGVSGRSITVSAPGMTGTPVTSANGPTFEMGRRYLVAGEGKLAWACGFSQPFDPDVAAEWAGVFADEVRASSR